MKMRPVDASGDVLPVLSAADMQSGAEAVAVLAADRLRLLTGDWWENPEWGCEILEMIWESRLKYETVQKLTTQELLFLMTAMEKAQIEKPLENYEENHQIIYSEILNRIRSAEKMSVLYDNTTGYPFLESGLCCVYLEQDRAKLAAEMYAKQFRKLNAVEVPLYTDMPDGRKKSFFDYLGYLGATWLLLDNGWYRARFKAGDVVNSIQWEETPHTEVKNPKLLK